MNVDSFKANVHAAVRSHCSPRLRKSIKIAVSARKGTMEIIVNSIRQRIFIDVTIVLRAPARDTSPNNTGVGDYIIIQNAAVSKTAPSHFPFRHRGPVVIG